MANTLKDQIDNLIGVQLASTLYDNWLVAGARTIVDILKPEDLERHSSSVTIPTPAGLAVSLYRWWRILVGNYEATPRPTGMEAQVVDTNSLHQASAFTPVYIVKAGTMKCYNGAQVAGELIGIQYPTAIDSSTATDVAGIPENMHYGVILYAAIQGRIKQMSELMKTTIEALAMDFSGATVPTALVAPSIAYVDASASSVVANTIGSLGTVPSYTAPTPTTAVPTLTITASAPTALATQSFTPVVANDFNYTNIIGKAALSISTQYTALAASLDTAEDIELATAKINEIQTRIQEWNTTAQEILNRLKTDNELKLTSQQQKYASILAEEVQAYDATVKRFSAELNLYQANVQRGLETYKSDMQKYQIEASKLQLDAVKAFEVTLETYKSTVQKAIEQTQITLQEALTNAKNSTDVAVQNKRAKLEGDVQAYDATVKRYQSEFNKYQTDIQKVIVPFQASVQRYIEEHSQLNVGLQQLQSEYHGLLNLYLGRETQPQQRQQQ